MAVYQSFDARIETTRLGRATHSLIRLPTEIAGTLQAEGAIRVEGEIGELPFNLALRPYNGATCLWTGQTLLRQINAQPGDTVPVRLRKADHDDVPVPEDLTQALNGSGLTEAWTALPPPKRRAALYRLDSAKRAETRAKRIAELLKTLNTLT